MIYYKGFDKKSADLLQTALAKHAENTGVQTYPRTVMIDNNITLRDQFDLLSNLSNFHWDINLNCDDTVTKLKRKQFVTYHIIMK